MANESKTPTVDIGILTIRDDEFRAVLKAFPDQIGIHRGRREYTLRRAQAGDGAKYTLAIVRQIEQGNGEAQDAARDLLDDFDPSLLLVVGIAGGLPSDDFSLGDVVLSTRVNDYSVEAKKAKSAPTYSMTGGPVAKAIATGIANLSGRQDELKGWTRGLPQKPPVNFNRKGQVYGPARWQKELKEKLESHFGRKAKKRPPVFVAGPIASSDRLIKDPKVLFPWVTTARHLLAVEMESGGVYRAARDRCPMLAIRGISDIVGLKRAEQWTKYACASAASFTKAYLKTQPVAPKKIGSPKTESTPVKVIEKSTKAEEIGAELLYSNLLPLRAYPTKMFVGPALIETYKQAWAVLLEGQPSGISNAWVLHDKNIYSFVDPSQSAVGKIVSVDEVDTLDTGEFVSANPVKHKRLLGQLLKGALRDDLFTVGVRYHHDDDVFAFSGSLDDEERTYRYQNVKVQSTITVVSHYQSKDKAGKSYPYLRHLAFAGRFREIENVWYLEITPTYRFTNDGKRKYFFHEQQLKGIKRLEGNRSVLSQVLLWSYLLGQSAAEDRPAKLLSFEKPQSFVFTQPISDGELESIESVHLESLGAEEEVDS